MKKHHKHKSSPVPPQGAPDITGMLGSMKQHLVTLERKIDILISRPSPGPAEAKPFHKPFQQSAHAHPQGERRHDNNFRERVLYKAVCADCKKDCEVPFKPSGERPVYCKECFSRRKAGTSFRERPDMRPREAAPVHAIHGDKPEYTEKTKPVEKKKPAAKRRKTRASK